MRSVNQLRLLITNSMMLCLLLALTTGVAEAHVLKEDNGISAVLHIPPEDNPAADQPTQLQLSFGDAKNAFTLQDCNCMVSVKSGTKTIQRVPLKPTPADATLAANTTVRFPAIGVYNVFVQGNAKDGKFNSFSLDYLVRVATSADRPSPSASNGSDAVTIGAGGLVVLVMVAYTGISRGGRYKMVTRQTKLSRRKKS